MSGSTSTVLSPLRNPFRTKFPPKDDPAYDALRESLVYNANTFSIKFGPNRAFHNHAAALLTCVYRLNGSPSEISSVLSTTPELASLQPLESRDRNEQSDLSITSKNWEEHLGGCGLFGLGAHLSYPGYRRFFVSEVEAHGADTVLASYLPRLATGSMGDFFHAIIELGYYFESGAPELLPVGLAWLASSYVELPDIADSSISRDETQSPGFKDPVESLAALSADTYPFPLFELHDGSSGYIAAMEDVAAAHLEVVLKYELDEITEGGAEARLNRLRGIISAAVESFGAGGCVDFYLLHLVTGSRAVWAVFKSTKLDLKVQDVLLKQLWKAVLLTHVVRGRPWRHPDVRGEKGPMESVDGLRGWEEIVTSGRKSANSHIAKVLMNLADFWDEWGEPRFWKTASDVVLAREAGKKLVGTGVGSQMGRFVGASGP